jgi:hypothetical protein
LVSLPKVMDAFCTITSLNRIDTGTCYDKLVAYVDGPNPPPVEDRIDFLLRECP